jgi:hypothetical protein
MDNSQVLTLDLGRMAGQTKQQQGKPADNVARIRIDAAGKKQIEELEKQQMSVFNTDSELTGFSLNSATASTTESTIKSASPGRTGSVKTTQSSSQFPSVAPISLPRIPFTLASPWSSPDAVHVKKPVGEPKTTTKASHQSEGKAQPSGKRIGSGAGLQTFLNKTSEKSNSVEVSKLLRHPKARTELH